MIHLKLLLTAIFWGGTFIAGRMLAGHVHPVSASFLRFAIASACLLMVLYKTHGRVPALPRRLWLPTLLLGLTGVFAYNILFFAGLQSVPASRASIIIANNPVMIALGAALLFKHRLGPIKSLGVLISVCGAIVAISRGQVLSLFSGGIGPGDWLIFGCVLSWVSFSLIGKTVLNSIPPLVAITYAAIFGSLLLLVPALLSGLAGSLASYRLLDWVSMAYLGVFGTVMGFVWYYEGIEQIGPTRAGLFINFVPLSAIVMAHVILREPITWSLAAG
ncbi:MAG: DMT family transporter, partial [Desulfosarcinaceae bacterium]